MTHNTSQQFDSLHAQYASLVLAIASRTLRRPAEVEDVAQTVWSEAWRAIQTGARLNQAWLTVCAQRRAIDRRRQLARDPHPLTTDGAEPADDGARLGMLSDCRLGLDRSLVEAIRGAIDDLPARTAEIMTMHYYGSRSIPDIARSLRISTGTVKWHLFAGRDSLRSMFLTPDTQEAA